MKTDGIGHAPQEPSVIYHPPVPELNVLHHHQSSMEWLIPIVFRTKQWVRSAVLFAKMVITSLTKTFQR